MRRVSAALGRVVGVLLLLSVAACSEDDAGAPSTDGPGPAASGTESGDGSGDASGTGSGAGSSAGGSASAPGDAATTAPYLPVPDGVALTMQGVDLELGDAATVAWEPRKSVVGALEIRVRRLQRAPIAALSAFRLTKVQRGSSLFYVRGSVRNVGATNLSGVDIPLYVLDGRDTLIQATPFAATFKPCPSAPMPKKFTTGATTSFCLVFLVPERGRLVGVSFRPTEEYDPITWTGSVEQRPGR